MNLPVRLVSWLVILAIEPIAQFLTFCSDSKR